MMQNRRKRRVFTKDFKKHIVDLHRSGKTRKDIIKEYDLTPSAFDKWVNQFPEISLVEESLENNNNGKENKGNEQIENLIRENEKLRYENEILKQAMFIFVKMVD